MFVYILFLFFTHILAMLRQGSMDLDECIMYTVRAEIFAVVLFSRISRVKPSQKFPLQFMSIYSNDNISKIAKLTTRELPHLAKTAKITVRENNGVYSTCMYQCLYYMTFLWNKRNNYNQKDIVEAMRGRACRLAWRWCVSTGSLLERCPSGRTCCLSSSLVDALTSSLEHQPLLNTWSEKRYSDIVYN